MRESAIIIDGAIEFLEDVEDYATIAIVSTIFAPTVLSLCLKVFKFEAKDEMLFDLMMFCISLMFEKSTCVLFSVLFKVFPPRLKISLNFS